MALATPVHQATAEPVQTSTGVGVPGVVVPGNAAPAIPQNQRLGAAVNPDLDADGEAAPRALIWSITDAATDFDKIGMAVLYQPKRVRL